MKRYTVSEAARIAKMSVRALHHYDEIGLCVPSARSDAGYRLYARADLERLQQTRRSRRCKAGRDMDVEELFAGFEAEARERWGETPEFAESQRRYEKYGPRDIETAKAEMAAIEDELATSLRAGAPPTSDEAMAVAEKHRLRVDRWWYLCPHEMHRRLGELYVVDARFAAHYDARQKGLARFLAAAIVANAAAKAAG